MVPARLSAVVALTIAWASVRERILTNMQTRSMSDEWICPVCSYPGLAEAPWAQGVPSDEICPSCSTHFGYDDAAGGDPNARQAFYVTKREEWRASGMKWWSTAEPAPHGWPPPPD
jgi:hypothetical protein